MSKELRKTITAAFRKFSVNPHLSPLKKQKDREIAGRFLDKLFTTTFDPGDLPYYSSNGCAKHANKAECVLAMMCDIVLTYWGVLNPDGVDHELSGHYTDQITNKLILLDRVYKEYSQLKLLGDVKGYCLLSSYRKDLLDVKKENKPEGEKTGTEEIDEGSDSTVEGGEAQIIKTSDVTSFSDLCGPKENE